MNRIGRRNPQDAKAEKKTFRKYMGRYWELYVMMLVPVCYLLLFKYVPMLGNILAFRRFKPLTGPYGVSWAQPLFRYFQQFMKQEGFWRAFRNTLIISVENLAINFPFPILFAVLFNELTGRKARRLIQTVSYMPRFISTVVVISILSQMLSPSTGVINRMLSQALGLPRIYYLNEPAFFRPLYILTDMWQYTGWTAIVYLSAILGVEKDLYEAAYMDGASRFQQIIYITIPSILPTIMVMLILNIGNLMSLGYEKVLLMQTPTNMAVSDIIDTYVYRLSLGASTPQYSLGTAIGLFNGIIGLILVSGSNRLSRRLTGSGIY